MTHDVKLTEGEFAPFASGEASALLAINKNYAIGDKVTLRELNARKLHHTGRVEMRRITNIGKAPAEVLSPRYVVLSLAPIA